MAKEAKKVEAPQAEPQTVTIEQYNQLLEQAQKLEQAHKSAVAKLSAIANILSV